MTTFPSINPDYGAQKRSQPNLKIVKFGDGYEQRLKVGLHNDPKDWTLKWSNITDDGSSSEAQQIEAFLEARVDDGTVFQWSPPDTTSTYDFVCYSWSKEITYPNRATITAVFHEVFEP